MRSVLDPFGRRPKSDFRERIRLVPCVKVTICGDRAVPEARSGFLWLFPKLVTAFC